MRSILILSVDDCAPMQRAVEEMVNKEGWRVDSCTDEAQALDRLASDTHYDAILLDHSPPGVDGLETARRARQIPHRRHAPVIILSVDQLYGAGRESYTDVYLRKPEGLAHLVPIIKRLLNIEEQAKTDTDSSPANRTHD
jgi:CheY-like chemotaxis protein